MIKTWSRYVMRLFSPSRPRLKKQNRNKPRRSAMILSKRSKLSSPGCRKPSWTQDVNGGGKPWQTIAPTTYHLSAQTVIKHYPILLLYATMHSLFLIFMYRKITYYLNPDGHRR